MKNLLTISNSLLTKRLQGNLNNCLEPAAIADVFEQLYLQKIKELEVKLVKQEIQKQKEISLAMISAQDRERNELSKELHDNVNQVLTSSLLFLDYASELSATEQEHYIEKSKQYLHLAIEEIRKISKSLSTSLISDVGLRQPVEELINTLMLTSHFTIKFHYEEVLEHELPAALKVTLYRIIQEQTNNIVKYANATAIGIKIKKLNNFLGLYINDNGQGFDLTKPKKGIGLANIKTRVEAFHGMLKINSSPGKGCCIKIMIPLIAH